eukprot:scaffold127187_cov29-Tisochrysis_lutea.AAC.8
MAHRPTSRKANAPSSCVDRLGLWYPPTLSLMANALSEEIRRAMNGKGLGVGASTRSATREC